ncbi:MAG: 2,3-bisphosphoglycerate-independent phosphoglycerate mutase [Desulfovibrionales bacterium]
MTFKPTLLLILDGWGSAPAGPGNALSLARMPNIDSLLQTFPGTKLQCAGEAVGLPPGQMGNSEVGHMNLGAGRVVFQDIQRISRALQSGELSKNPVLNDLISKTREGGGAMHLMGLVSPGGVHSLQTHLYGLVKLCKERGIDRVFVHAILDGRDTPPKSGFGYLSELSDFLRKEKIGRIATVSGRYYAMDRDKRWERTKLAYDALVSGEGIRISDPLRAVEQAHLAGESDEFVRPRVITTNVGDPVAPLGDGDGFFFFNFRADRARQIVQAIFDPDFKEFERSRVPHLSAMATMTMYDEQFPLPTAFPPLSLRNILPEVVSRAGIRQLRLAETEKYAHVTYFFNGGEERTFDGEERILIPSPREVPTYDHKPEMSLYEVTEQLCEAIESKKFQLIVCNFANLDMVGHTGSIQAAVKACEAVDECVGRVARCVLDAGARMFLTSDHGNAEEMLDGSGSVQTAHSTNMVPFVWVEDQKDLKPLREKGIIGDIAPTMLHLWGVEIPSDMTGKTLIKEDV